MIIVNDSSCMMNIELLAYSSISLLATLVANFAHFSAGILLDLFLFIRKTIGSTDTLKNCQCYSYSSVTMFIRVAIVYAVFRFYSELLFWFVSLPTSPNPSRRASGVRLRWCLRV